mgnify:CR=1 FL=1
MLNCRGDMGIGGAWCPWCGLGDLVILLLEMGVMDTGGASPNTELRQQLMQIGQCSD